MKNKPFTYIIMLALVLALALPGSLVVAAEEDMMCYGHNDPAIALIKFEGPGTFYYEGVVVVVSGATVTFSQPVRFCVKAGTSNSGEQTGTSYTVDFENTGGQFPDISHVVIYEILDFGQWCSPGYWRQEQHLDSWELTGYHPEDPFMGTVVLSPQGLSADATLTPTLWQVLQSPQWYGGETFNLVGDLLSDTHPDVNFSGTRVEDSCPLD